MKQHPYRLLTHRLLIWLRNSLSFLWLVVVAGYLMVLAGQAFYQNYQSQKDTQALKDKLVADQRQKERLEALLVYYRTDSFKEKELRRTLLMKRPNEKVYALPESSLSQRVEDQIASTDTKPHGTFTKQPIWQQWLDYLFYPSKEG